MRLAVPAEQSYLEELQRRAPRKNPGDRAAELANPASATCPSRKLQMGRSTSCDLDGLFVEPESWGLGFGAELVERIAETARSWRGPERTLVPAPTLTPSIQVRIPVPQPHT
jgi:GNAT superfamily N-acetyltransferase